MEKKICPDCNSEKQVSEFYINGTNAKTGKTYYLKACKNCSKQISAIRFRIKYRNDSRFRELRHQEVKNWKNKNPEKRAKHQRKHKEKLKAKNPDKLRKQRQIQEKREIDELRNIYVRHLLGGSRYDSLIPIKREQIRLLRLCKKLESQTSKD